MGGRLLTLNSCLCRTLEPAVALTVTSMRTALADDGGSWRKLSEEDMEYLEVDETGAVRVNFAAKKHDRLVELRRLQQRLRDASRRMGA